jgi:hypothetical protein
VIHDRLPRRGLAERADARVAIDHPRDGTIVALDKADFTQIGLTVTDFTLPEDGMVCLYAIAHNRSDAQTDRQCVDDISQPLYWGGPAYTGTYTLVASLFTRGPDNSMQRAGSLCTSTFSVERDTQCSTAENTEAEPQALPVVHERSAELKQFAQALGAAGLGATDGTAILNVCDGNLKQYLGKWVDMLGAFGRRHQHVIVAIDGPTEQYCTANRLNCVRWPSAGSLSPPKVGYDWIKFSATLMLLEVGVAVLMSEMDVVWLHDPLAVRPHGESAGAHHWGATMAGRQSCKTAAVDLEVSGHALHPRVNCGYYHARPTARSLSFFAVLVERTLAQARSKLADARVPAGLPLGALHFHQLELDGLLDNSDFLFPDAAGTDILLSDVTAASLAFRRPPLCWKKLDYSVFGSGDGVDARESLVTVHAFVPLRKEKVMDAFYSRLQGCMAGSSWPSCIPDWSYMERHQALPQVLRQPSELVLYQYRAPGYWYNIPQHDAAVANDTFAYDVLVDPLLPLRSDVLFCFTDLPGLSLGVNLHDLDVGKLPEDATVCAPIHQRADWASAWQRGSISKGIAGLVLLQRLEIRGFSGGRHRVAVWLADAGLRGGGSTPLHSPVFFTFNS